MKYYNVKVKIILKEPLQDIETYEKISNLISQAMLKDESLKEIHEKNMYKNYVCCNLYPIEKDAKYKRNKIYSFDVRGIEFEKMIKIKQVLNNLENKYFKVIKINFQTSEQRKITKLITLTPAIITTEKGDFEIKNNLVFVKKRILSNIEKTYQNNYKTKIEINFVKELKKTNEKPFKIPYKNIHMLGNKFEIYVEEDQLSQQLAYLALSIGILEKNSLGFGFCIAN